MSSATPATTSSFTLSDASAHPSSLRWLVVGADGMLGRELLSSLRQDGANVLGTSRREGSQHLRLDLSEIGGETDLPPADIVILTAAMTRIADCESDPKTSHRINVSAPLSLAKHAWQEHNAFVVFISSSGVFDGVNELPNPQTHPRPLNLYGRQKTEAEAALTEAAVDNFGLAIIRPTKILGPSTPLLVEWETALTRGTVIRPHAWRSMAPLSVRWATRAIATIAADRAAGIWHLSAAEDVSFADFANKWVASRGFPSHLIHPEEHSEISPSRARLDMQATMQRFRLSSPTLDTVVSDLITPPLDGPIREERTA